MIENIVFNGDIYAIIIRANYEKEGISFVTPNDFSQQLAYMKHPAGKVIAPHIHNFAPREVTYTQEVLFIKSGQLKVDFFNENKQYLDSRSLSAGDVILLAKGGHGFEVLEPVEMFEVKQGPYMGENDKTHI